MPFNSIDLDKKSINMFLMTGQLQPHVNETCCPTGVIFYTFELYHCVVFSNLKLHLQSCKHYKKKHLITQWLERGVRRVNCLIEPLNRVNNRPQRIGVQIERDVNRQTTTSPQYVALCETYAQCG